MARARGATSAPVAFAPAAARGGFHPGRSPRPARPIRITRAGRRSSQGAGATRRLCVRWVIHRVGHVPRPRPAGAIAPIHGGRALPDASPRTPDRAGGRVPSAPAGAVSPTDARYGGSQAPSVAGRRQPRRAAHAKRAGRPVAPGPLRLVAAGANPGGTAFVSARRPRSCASAHRPDRRGWSGTGSPSRPSRGAARVPARPPTAGRW